MGESTKARWLRCLRTGEGVSDNWRGVMSIANGLAAAGLPDSTLRALLLDDGNEGVRYVHFSSAGVARPTSSRERMVRDAIRKVRQRQARSKPFLDRGAAIEALAEVRGAIDADPSRWRQRAGATDRAVLLGAIVIAERLGRLQFDASVRQLADAAGVGVHGAHAALGRLRGWLRVVEIGEGTRASTVRLERRSREPTSVPEGTEPEGSRHDLSADAWRWGRGIGKRAQHAYELLGASPLPTDEVAALLGVGPRTARHHLSRLKEFRLAERLADGWVLGPADPDAVAVDLAIAGEGKRQREKHAAHSEQRREWLAERRPERQRRERKEARRRSIASVLSPDAGSIEREPARVGGGP